MWVIDDFLPPSLYNDLQRLLLGSDISWSYSPGSTVIDGVPADEFYFVHNVIKPGYASPIFNDIRPILYFLDDRFKFHVDELIRINCTMCTNQGSILPQGMHTDFPFEHYTGIYYINTTNGPTLFKDTKVDSVANRFVLFDGRLEHAACIQDDTQVRVNIVFNMKGHFRQNNS